MVIDKLEGVHPKLIEVVEEASKHTMIIIAEGVRTLERQKQLVKDGKSRTLNSKHLKQKDGFGHAVDLYPPKTKDWSKKASYEPIAKAMKEAAKKVGIKIEWGGDWKWMDCPHFQVLEV